MNSAEVMPADNKQYSQKALITNACKYKNQSVKTKPTVIAPIAAVRYFARFVSKYKTDKITTER